MMMRSIEAYRTIVGDPVIDQLYRMGERLQGVRVVHVNTTTEGGGVAEILGWMVPLMRDLGLDAYWKVIRGNQDFFSVTKAVHNGLQGYSVALSTKDWDTHRAVNEWNLSDLRDILEASDIVVIHDPQPAPLLNLCTNRSGKWIWRAHIDISHPHRPVWKFLRPYLEHYDASIFSMQQFAQLLPHPQFIIAPSIDPLSDKNIELDQSETDKVREEFHLDPTKPLLVQVSRFDRFKDPIGVINAYRQVRSAIPVQLVLAGGGATDDPEGSIVLEEVLEAAKDDPDIHVCLLPPDAHRTINALQRLADIIIQKSTKEGFGLTVTEGMWKGKPVIGGDSGGIRRQVIGYSTGFLVNTPEGAANRIRFLLHHRDRLLQMGNTAREFVREHYLLTRHLREYLTLFLLLRTGMEERRIFI
jgi:trehalose synthase